MFDTVEIKDVKNEIGLLIKAMRRQRGISQTRLAKSLHLSRTTIQNLEIGKNFTVDTILKILKEMDLLEQLHSEISQAKKHVVNSKSMY